MRSNSYRNYIRKSFFKFAAITILLLFFIMTSFFYINIKCISENTNRKYNKKISDEFEKNIISYKLNLDEFSNNIKIKKALKQMDKNSITDANHLLYGFCNSNILKSDFILVGKDSKIVSSNLFEPNREMFLKSNLYKNIKQRLSSDENILMLPSHINYSNSQMGDLIMAKSVKEGKNILGYIFFDLTDESIHNLAVKYPLSEVVIMDRYDNIIYSSGRQTSDTGENYIRDKYRVKNLKDKTAVINQKSYKVENNSIDSDNITICTLVRADFENMIIKYSFLYLSSVMLIMIVLLVPLTYKITGKSSYAIDELQKSINEIGRGNMDYVIDKSVFDEFSMLYYKFKKIVVQREKLLKANNELLERKRQMEIKRLEEQINPHFIFNVLETLRYEILIDRDKASEMVMSFAEILRYSIYYKGTMVALETDVEYINDYLLLQKMRYNESLKYKIDIPEELFSKKIPKLLLQPVVENSLKHGMNKKEKICIEIKAYLEGNNLVLTVSDDGGGMDQESLKKLENSLNSIDVEKQHIGLFNTHRIIKLLYGNEYGLKIKSIENKGTEVIITIPSSMEE